MDCKQLYCRRASPAALLLAPVIAPRRLLPVDVDSERTPLMGVPALILGSPPHHHLLWVYSQILRLFLMVDGYDHGSYLGSIHNFFILLLDIYSLV